MSSVDQDDSYGNYKPAFLTKKRAVNGRSPQIMMLQRQASYDMDKAILKKFHDVIPDPPLGKRVNHEQSDSREIYNIVAPNLNERTSSSPRFYRKAEESYPHDMYPKSPNKQERNPQASSGKKIPGSLYKN